MTTYVSSSCVKHEKIIDSIHELVAAGITSVELSGGTKPYNNLLSDLLRVKNELNVNLLLHNYFPPPKEDFVLNLASSDELIYKKSIDHCKNAIDLSEKIGAKKFGFHAGFFIDIKLNEIGKKLSFSKITDHNRAYDKFCSAFEELNNVAGDDVKLFIENNVFSASNYESFGGVNPLMLTDVKAYNDLSKRIDFNLLLDVAHLKVSTKTLDLTFEDELNQLFNVSEYIHVSDNDSLHDTNREFKRSSQLFKSLSNLNWKGKTVTAEVYETLDKVKNSVDNINGIANVR